MKHLNKIMELLKVTFLNIWNKWKLKLIIENLENSGSD